MTMFSKTRRSARCAEVDRRTFLDDLEDLEAVIPHRVVARVGAELARPTILVDDHVGGPGWSLAEATAVARADAHRDSVVPAWEVYR